jgi:DNA repair protein RadC
MIYLKDSKIEFKNTQEIAKVFQDLLLLEDEIEQEKEHFYVMHLNAKSQLKTVELVNLGTLTASLGHPRETFRRAVIAGSASIIVAHNHPSGEIDPSAEDTKVTRLLMDGGNILGIKMLDHIIFTKDKFFSVKENRVQKIQGEKLDEKRSTL